MIINKYPVQTTTKKYEQDKNICFPFERTWRTDTLLFIYFSERERKNTKTFLSLFQDWQLHETTKTTTRTHIYIKGIFKNNIRDRIVQQQQQQKSRES